MQALLESNSIDCRLKDAYSAVMAPFLANAIGGIKLMVREEDIGTANQLLEEAGYVNRDAAQQDFVKKDKTLLWLLLAAAVLTFYFILKTFRY